MLVGFLVGRGCLAHLAIVLFLLTCKKRGEEGTQQGLGNNIKADGRRKVCLKQRTGQKEQQQRMGEDIKAAGDVRLEDNEQTKG